MTDLSAGRPLPLPEDDLDITGKTIKMRRDTYVEDVEKIRQALADRRYIVISDDGVYVPPAVEQPEVDGSPE